MAITIIWCYLSSWHRKYDIVSILMGGVYHHIYAYGGVGMTESAYSGVVDNISTLRRCAYL